MTKTKLASKDKERPNTAADAPPSDKASNRRAMRETIESFVVALVWAFLFRTFEAEPFVIPTGSMAPTLMGRHLDVTCPTCKYNYRAGAREDFIITETYCPMCHAPADVDPSRPGGKANPVYNGDRVIVSKFAYDFSAPKRWDVFVFKYPGNASMNYIKRLVGLPNETLGIHHGDLFLRPTDDEQAPPEIARKPPEKVLAMAQPVYDNDYVVDAMTQAGWPLRWQNWAPERKDLAWASDDGGRSFAIVAAEGDGKAAGGAASSAADETLWLRYQNFVPSAHDWDAIEHGALKDGPSPRPQLITDYYAYNDTRIGNGAPPGGTIPFGVNWVADLKLDVELEFKTSAGVVALDLVSGGKHLGCEIDVATGEVTFKIEGRPDFHPHAKTALRGPGTHRVAFANFDRQLTLFVDGKPVSFDGPATYGFLDNDLPTEADLAPAGIGSRGAGVAARHLRIDRDVYYIADKSTPGEGEGMIQDFSRNSELFDLLIEAGFRGSRRREEFLSDPRQWQRGPDGKSIFDERRAVTFELRADQFFALGDNSPMSADSRLWDKSPHYVERSLLIGKAVIVYWPRAAYSLPLPFGPVDSIPLVPNFARMRFVR